MNRRQFLGFATLAGIASASRTDLSAQARNASAAELKVHLFSKHLQFLELEEMAEKAASLGFDGIDLTVRPGGHVEPKEATRLLPLAARALRANGLEPRLCTTGFSRADDPYFEATLGAIADAGFRDLRLGWHKYPKNGSLVESLESLKPVAADLAMALERFGLRGSFQNHSGQPYVGSTVWELWQVLEEVDPKWLALQFDIRHATVERGLSWPNELALAVPKIASIVLKDFRWEENPETGRGEVVDVSIGEGWVNFPWYFKLLRKRYDVDVPASLHLEHPLGGAEHGKRSLEVSPEAVFSAMRRDLERVRSRYRQALAE